MSEIITANKALTSDLYPRFCSFIDAKPKTVETYTKALRKLSTFLAANNVKQPCREDILAFKQSLIDEGKKPTTIQTYITAVRLFFQWLQQEGIYPNIAEHIKGAKLDREHKKDYLTSNQVKEMLHTVNRNTVEGLRDYAMLTLMVTGGLRTIEVSRALVEDLRTVGDSTVLMLQGKGRDEKTEYVKIAPAVEAAIRAYLKARGKVEKNQPLFASLSHNNKGGAMTTRAISGIAKAAMIEAGYNDSHKTAHSLRHTAVTLSLLAGKDITEVQQFARHADIATTLIYDHALEKAKNSCSEAVANSIF